MSSSTTPAPESEHRFTWHPDYAGETREELVSRLTDELMRDQRAYAAALEAAETEEHASLSNIIDLERRWSGYHFSWQETEPEDLAEEIADFEWAREQAQEMVSWKDYRARAGAPSVAMRAMPAEPREGFSISQISPWMWLAIGMIMAWLLVQIIQVLL